jgi:hypothetical protein
MVVTADGTVSVTPPVQLAFPAGRLMVNVALVFPAVGHAAMKSVCEGLAALQTDVVQLCPKSCRGATRQSARLPSMNWLKNLGVVFGAVALIAFSFWAFVYLSGPVAP